MYVGRHECRPFLCCSADAPGDPLYIYKIEVTERVEGYVANAESAGDSFDMYVLGQRLEEARTLAVRGKLTVENQTAVTDTITTEVRSVLDRIAVYQSVGNYSGAAAVGATLFTTLQTESQKVAEASSRGSVTLQTSLAPILIKLTTTLNTVSHVSMKAQDKVAGTTVAVALLPVHRAVLDHSQPIAGLKQGAIDRTTTVAPATTTSTIATEAPAAETSTAPRPTEIYFK